MSLGKPCEFGVVKQNNRALGPVILFRASFNPAAAATPAAASR